MVLPVPKSMIVKSGSLSVDLSKIEYFTDEQLMEIVDWFVNNLYNNRKNNKHKFERERYYLLMKVMLLTGARRGEALKLKKEDFDVQNNVVKMVTLKRKKRLPIRSIPLHSDLRDTYLTYLNSHTIQNGELLFPMTKETVSAFFAEIGKQLGFRVYPHKFRHTFAVKAILNNVPLNVVQKWLGHSSIFTTSIYTELGATDTQNWMNKI